MPAEAAGLVAKTQPSDLSPGSSKPVELGKKLGSAPGAPWLAKVVTLVRGVSCKIKGVVETAH